MTLRHTASAALATAALAFACQSGTPSETKPAAAAKAEGPVVATVGPTTITAAEVQKKLGEQSPFLQARYRELSHRKEFVQNLVRFEVLAQEAYRKGLDKEPEVAATLKKVLVQELIRQAFDEKQATYTDDELRAYYDKHIDEFVKPERVRAQHIFVAAPAAEKAARGKAKTLLAGLLAQLKANEAKAPLTHPQHASYSTTLFADLAREHSKDTTTQPTGGDLRYLSKDDMGKQYSPEFATAVFALANSGDLSGVIETPAGLHIARLTNRQLAVNRSFDDAQVRDTIKGRLFREQRTKSFDEYVDTLKKNAGVVINEEVLATVEVPAQALPPNGSSPNALPVAPVAGKPQ
jgi:peptidyl-prolyl cis-trans isomerase C